MVSPFYCKPNATLTFEVATDAIADDTANFTLETKLIKVQAFMRSASKNTASQFGRLPGVDDATIMVEAFCVSPQVLPAAVAEEAIAHCTFAGLKGNLYLHPFINPPFGRGHELEQRIGTRLIAWFQLSRSL